MKAKHALEALSNKVVMTAHEQGSYESGARRFEKIVRFATIGAVKGGWLVKTKGTWSITDAGKLALEKFPDAEALVRESDRFYQEWRKSQPAAPREKSGDGTEVESEDGERTVI